MGEASRISATLAVLSTVVDAQKGSSEFASALDGDVLASGDFVRSNNQGGAELTFFDASTLSVDPGSLVNVRQGCLSVMGTTP